MRIFRVVVRTAAIVSIMALLGALTVQAEVAAPWEEQGKTVQGLSKVNAQRGPMIAGAASAMAPGDPVSISGALAAASGYLNRMQADVTEDNAGNGSGALESPNDPDDGGWDWVVTSPPAPFFHTTAASPKNIYGVTALGLYHGYLASGNPTYFTALTDAANKMVADAGIRSASDLIFLMRYNDLPGVSGTAYKDSAKAKFDARIALYGSADSLAKYIRNVRGASYPNGIIGWDIGTYVQAAAMLASRYPSDPYSYATAADDMAEVLWQDSFNSNPGLFDVVADAGWDPTWSNVNYWWYTLGVSGLIQAFTSSNTHMAEVPGLAARLVSSQFSNGAISGSYGANATDEDWQSTAYAAPALAAVNLPLYQGKINHMAYWLGATQDPSGGWKYSDNTHYPEIGGECASALALGQAPSYVIVDDGFASQADVDVYNAANGTDYVFGYDAFGTIQAGVDAVSGSTVMVLPGTYILSSTVNLNKTNLTIDGAGAGSTIVQVAQSVGYAFNISASGVTLRDIELQKTDVTGVHNLIYIGASNASILNNLIYGPDPGTPWSVNGIVSRAMISTGGLTGLLIDNNTIHHLRQPGYFSGPTTGVISNNAVSGTRGWVNEGANLTFTNNNWPLPPNQGAEIALLATLGANGPVWYPDLMALSNANNNAYVDAQFTPADKGRAISYVDDSALPGGFGSALAPVQTISAGISGVLTTGTVNVAAGTYTDNLVVGKAMTLLGAGAGTCFVYPLLSAPMPGASGSLPAGASNMVLVQASNVSISGFTFDGNNTALTSGVLAGGVDVDARNGIITNHTLGLYNNLTVDNCTIKNIYLRGIYASSGGTFNFHHNNVDNVQGEYASIGMFNFNGSGVFDHNTVSNCNDAIASNWSTGCTFTNNIVTASGSGIHTDNAGNAAGSVADLIENNSISNSPANGYGIFVFAPYVAPVINLNTITNVDYALTCAGSYASVTPQFTNNIADGMDKPNSAGVYVTTDIWGYASGNVAVNFENNTFKNFTEGVYLVAEAGKTNSTTLLNNNIVQNGLGISNGVGLTYGGGANVGATISATLNSFANTVNATDNKSGNAYSQNCWSDWSGVGTYLVGGSGGNIDASPNVDCGLDMTPNSIVYHCSGDFTFDVGIGEAVFDLEGAHIIIEYPASLVLSGVTSASPNFSVFTSLVDNTVGNDILTVDLGVLTGAQNGPATLFTVALNGSVSLCSGAQITMTTGTLRDGNNNPIIASLAYPVSVVADCGDPSFTVNSPAPGGIYNVAPVLNISAADDCGLDAVYYQYDGCLSGGWQAIATGLAGTSYSNAAWTIPGWAGLLEGAHCLRFKAKDDNGRGNADSCSFTWCFTKDVTPPLPPTNLTATPGHNKVHLNWTNAASDFDHVVVMRSDWYAGGHGYPEYDDDNPEGAYPSDTTSFDRVYAGTAATLIDIDDLSNATRDVYHYRAFTVDAAGNVSAPSNSARSTSYWLGDVKSPYDGSVYSQDLFVFAPTYGKSHGQAGYNNEVDFGPTFNMSPKGIPTTDNVVNFEDLVIFAINFDAVSPLLKFAPIFASTPADQSLATGLSGLSLVIPDVAPAVGESFTVKVMMANSQNNAKAVRFTLPYDAKQLEYVGTAMSAELRQSPAHVFFDARETEQMIDVSLALLGGETAIGGSGEIATMTFKLLAAGGTSLDFNEVDFRDGGNNRLEVTHRGALLSSNSALPASYALDQNYPNPFNAGTQIVYQLRERTNVSLAVYNISGQLVTKLLDGIQEPGRHSITWDGRGTDGDEVPSGVYFYRMIAGDYTATKKMMIVK